MAGLCSQRMTVLLTPEAKGSIEARAAALGIPAGEYARRALEAYDPARDEAALRVLAEELDRVVATTEMRVDDALRELDRLRSALREADRARGLEHGAPRP